MHRSVLPLFLLLAAAASAQSTDVFTVLLGEGNVAAIRPGPSGSTYVLGSSASAELPTKSAFQPELAPGDCDGRLSSELPCPDLFLAKLDPNGELLFLTYLGGAGREIGIDLAVDSGGVAYVLGKTESETEPESGSVGPAGLSDGPFLAQVSADGQALLGAVALPGEPTALALDGNRPIVVGITQYDDVPVIGATPAPISDSAFFAPGPEGSPVVRNAGLSGPIVDIQVIGSRLFVLANDVFVSSDGGESWTASGQASVVDHWVLESDTTRVIAAAPDDPLTVYAAAQGKLLRTRSAGASWTDVTPTLDQASDRPLAVAAGSGGRLYTGSFSGTYRSDDYGETWTHDDQRGWVIRLLVDAANPDSIYAQQAQPFRFGNGLFFSADGGVTWQDRTFPTTSQGAQWGAASLFLDPADSSHLYGLFGSLYESLDGGQSWSTVGVTPYETRRIVMAEQGVFYALTDSGPLRSTDGAQTWQPLEGFLPLDYSAIAADPRDPQKLYVAARGSRQDGYLMRLAPDLQSISISTKFGGFGQDNPAAVVREPSGDYLVAGVSGSVDYPSMSAYAGGDSDFFVTRFSPTDLSPLKSTLLGGSAAEFGGRLAVAPDGAVYVAGAALSPSLPALAETSPDPVTVATPVVVALDQDLEAIRFSRFFDIGRAGCVQGVSATSSAIRIAGSAAISLSSPCAADDTNGRFFAGESFVASLAPDGVLQSGSNILGSSIRGSIATPDGNSLLIAADRYLGPSTSPFDPAGTNRSAFGAFVVRLGPPVAAPALARVAAVVDAAAYTGGPLAPGLIASLFGSGLGPVEGATAPLVDGKLPLEAGGVRTLVNGQPSPMLFAQDGQINFIASFALEPRTMAKLEVETAAGRSAPWFLPVSVSHAGLFSDEGLGRGLLLALNQDGTLNDAEHPAPVGSVVTVFAVGLGQMSPPLEDGSIAPGELPLPTPDLDIALTADGRYADILYAGAAPELAAGVAQINFRIPDANALPRRLPILLYVGAKRFGERGRLELYVSQ